MSRIGKNPIVIPSGVTVTVGADNLVTVKGAKGELSHKVNAEIKVEVKENEVVLTRPDDTPASKSLHGLNRTLVDNMVTGVTKGFEKRLEIIGVGFRANIQGKKLVLSLGFSHPVDFMIPEGITITQDEENKNILIVQGIDKQKVGQCAANIRAHKKPEPYKGKGIRYVDEYVRRKAGKAASAA